MFGFSEEMGKNNNSLHALFMKEKTIVILGNGFDLDLGLRTSFRNYLNSSVHAKFNVNTTTFHKIDDKSKKDWGDIEGVLRKSILEVFKINDEELDEDINVTWNMIRKGWGIYLPEHIGHVQNLLNQISGCTFKEKSPINKNSCAYTFARKILNWDSVFTFNYTNPADLLFGKYPNGIHFIHGSITPHRHSLCQMCKIENNIAIGVDSQRMNALIRDKELLSPIMKLHFMGEGSCRDDLNKAMLGAKNIIFFGHSMSITDSDYFEDFFHGIIEGLIVDKSFFFITKDSNGLSDIKKHMSEWGIVFDKLNNSGNQVFEIFTDNGVEDEDFKRCLDTL